MSDYANKTRNGNDKRYDGNRKSYPGGQYSHSQYINPHFKGGDKQNLSDKRKSGYRKSGEGDSLYGIISKAIPGIVAQLEAIGKNQALLVDIGQRIAVAEEQKAAALTELISIWKNDGKSELTPQPTLSANDAPPQASLIGGAAPAPQPVESIDKPDEAEKQRVINMVIEMRKSSLSYGQICQRLIAENVKTFSGRGEWHPQTVQKIGAEYFQDETVAAEDS